MYKEYTSQALISLGGLILYIIDSNIIKLQCEKSFRPFYTLYI
jgi:hypothetical protein